MGLRACVVLLALTACTLPQRSGGRRPLVVTTVSPITDIVEQVAGGRARVEGLVPEGTNSHTFEPAPRHARLLAEADAVIVNGLDLETPMVELARKTVGDGVPIVHLAEQTIEPSEYIFDFSFPRSAGAPNPHLWTNPLYARHYAELVAGILSELDPRGARGYRMRLRRFTHRIERLDGAVRVATKTVPAEHRRLLTFHDSFPYFAREYGWEIIGAIQPSDFSEPTPRDVADLIDQIEAADVPAVFGSEVFPSPVLEQISRATGARYVADLRDDDLPGEEGDPQHSYVGLMAFDFRTIVEALGGDASALEGIDLE